MIHDVGWDLAVDVRGLRVRYGAPTACTLLAPAGCVLWPVVLGELTRRRFRWEPRSTT